MKCTQCGCKKFIKTSFSHLINVSGWDVRCYISETVNVFACLGCGHLEFFDKEMPNKLAQAEMTFKKCDDELNSLMQEKNSQDNTIKELTEKQKRIEEELKNLDITVREQNELTEKHKQINNEIDDLVYKKRNIDRIIEQATKNREKANAEVQKLRSLCIEED